MRSLFGFWLSLFLLAATACSETAAAPQGFEQISSAPGQAQVFKSKSGEEVRIASLETLQSLNSVDPDLRSTDPKKKLEAALYVVDLGLPEVTQTLDDSSSQPMVEGTAYTEDGEDITFVGAWRETPNGEHLVLVLMPSNMFDRERAKMLARSDRWDATKRDATPEIIASDTDESTPTRSSNASYPVPMRTSENDPRWAGWHYHSDTEFIAKVGDPAAPRAKRFLEVSPTKRGPRVALNAALEAYGVDRPKLKTIVETQIARQLVGDPNFISLGTSNRNGQDAVVFAQINQGQDSDALSVFLLEVDEATYEAWGGIASTLSATGVINAPSDIPEQYRQQLASAPFDQQLAFYHLAYTEVMKSYFSGFVAANTSTLTMMQNMNFDLLFEGEISLDTITGSK